ncbi:ATP-binding protein [Corynebacterium atypicum]|uniref:tRNA threonylcarbamoyladenosine biosynthesis protein TsaE n=1 Tax=Corynebacterium atypicum TaxID=191610 RepID=A0ABM5QLL5_9CORY|nr:ATP-binding protein [Corynebacterium atypicum]
MRPEFLAHGRVRAEEAEDTRELGRRLGEALEAGDVVVLSGPLGAGKTTFTQGIARGMGVRGRVTSPTFTIAREHRPQAEGPALVHVDAYRLLGESAEEAPAQQDLAFALDSLDLDSELDQAAVVMEWGAGLAGYLAGAYLLVELDRTTAAAANPDSEARFISWAWCTSSG